MLGTTGISTTVFGHNVVLVLVHYPRASLRVRIGSFVSSRSTFVAQSQRPVAYGSFHYHDGVADWQFGDMLISSRQCIDVRRSHGSLSSSRTHQSSLSLQTANKWQQRYGRVVH